MIRVGRALGAVALVSMLFACGGDSPSSERTVDVTITDAGCDPFQLTVPKGRTTFHVKNDGADGITEFEVLDGAKIIGEKENLTAGLEANVTIDLSPGEYSLACPGGTQHPTGTLSVTEGDGAASSDAPHGSADASGCVPTGSSDSPSSHVKVGLQDFDMQLDPGAVDAGAIAIDGTNSGPHPHEILIVKGVAPAAIPSADDGTVDETRLPAGASIGEIEAFSAGRSCSGTFKLDAGTYTLFCNVIGDEGAHFKLGMVSTLTVK